ncbi:MAG TPA: glycosyltransferase [Saprospiraceae bacterium]|nr:glycosyltransferase [Saprospiraceae bacterium]
MEKITIKPDVIVACWTSGFLNFDILGKIGTYFSSTTYVYTADMSPFTGGCHYAWDCVGYMHNCMDCPALCLKTRHLAAENIVKKKRAIEKYGIKAFAFSDFTFNQVRQSSLFKYQEYIPSFQGLVSEEYFYIDKEKIIRINYSIPENRIVVVLGALNLYERRKGFKELINALNLLQREKPDLAKKMLLIAIGDEKDIQCSIELRFLPFTKNLKILGDYYRLADIYANASLEDSGPQMLLQAMACGAIPVSFDTGFGSELLDGVTGFKAPVGDINSFSDKLIEAAELSEVKRLQMLNSIAEKISRDNSLSRLHQVFNSL